MELSTECEKAKNEAQRKIGRNLILYQQVEFLLKLLLRNINLSGYPEDIIREKEKRKKELSRQTLGNLVGQYVENTYSVDPVEIKEGPDNLKGPYFSFSNWVEVDADYYEKKKEKLASFVEQRNELVHHLIPRLDPLSLESWMELEKYLDQQREEILPELTELQDIIKGLKESGEMLMEFLNSDEGLRFLAPSRWLRQSPLVTLLRDITPQAARPDGWTSLPTAGALIQKHAPEERAVLKDKYGHNTLKKLMMATRLFEFSEEATSSGGVRILYRLK